MNGKEKCTATSKRSGQRCKNYPTPGMPVCRFHGGKSLSGLASPALKTGLYSKHLPTRLEADHEALLHLGNEIFRIADETALITGLIQEQLEKMEQGESGAAWKSLQTIYDTMVSISSKPTQTPAEIREYNDLFSDMGPVLKQGGMAYAARDEVTALIEGKRRLVADERKDQAAKHQAMAYNEVMLMLTAMVSAFRQALNIHLEDEKKRRSILTSTKELSSHVIPQ